MMAVNVVKCIKETYHEAEDAGLGNRAFCCGVLGGELVQRDAVDVFYYVVCGTVFFEIGVDFGNAGMVESSQQSDFAQEVVSGPLIAFLAFFRVVHADIERAFMAVAERIREAFLDDDVSVEQGFLSQIGYAEAAPADAALNAVAM